MLLLTEISVIRPVAPIECRRGDSETARQRSVPCFLAGDLRANEHVSEKIPYLYYKYILFLQLLRVYKCSISYLKEYNIQKQTGVTTF